MISKQQCEFFLPAASSNDNGDLTSRQCPNLAGKSCMLCNQSMCPEHESEQESDYCRECLDETKSELKERPAPQKETLEEDENGNEVVVKHNQSGRVLEPVGEFWISTCGAVSKMSDEELGRQINAFTIKVREAEQMTDRRRITLSMMHLEQHDRKVANINKLKGVPFAMPDGTKKKIPTKKLKEDPEKAVMEQMAASLGLKPEQMAALIASLAAK